MMNNKALIINLPKASVSDGWYRLSAAIDVENAAALERHKQEIWFAIPSEYSDEFVQQDCSDCFLLGLLYFAMRNGYDLKVKGTISKQLLYNLNKEIMPIMSAYRTCIKPVEIFAENTTDYPPGKNVGTGFSAGIDSFFTIYSNLLEHIRPEDKLTHLFFFNVGTHYLGNSFEELEHARQKFLMRYNSFKPATKEIGLPFIPIDSNVHSFLPDNVAAVISLCNASVIHFLRKGIRMYYLSSAGYNYAQWFDYIRNSPPESRIDLALIENLLSQWLGDVSLSIIPFGSNVTRVEKTKLLLDFKPFQHFVNVCNSVDTMNKNCSVCLKCRRTMLDLELMGRLDDFRDVFDVDLYRSRFKSRDFAELLYPPPRFKNVFLNSSLDFAKQHQIDIRSQTTRIDRICAFLHQSWIYSFLKRLNILEAIKHACGRK